MRWLLDFWIEVQAWILETIVNPALFKLGLMTFLDDAPALVEIVMLGVVQIAVIACVFMPLERLAPAERWPDHKLARVDVVYTLLNKLGVMPLLVFLVLYDLNDLLLDAVREHGLVMPTIELHVPWLRDKPLLLFAIYFLVYDFAGYWLHRMQHGFRWWWALHSLHHSQRQMTCWSDDRNHVLDDLLTSLYFAFVALAIGVAPGQFVMILLLGRLIESFSHINLRFGFGRYLDKVVVDPWFHRTHHAMASPAEPHIHDRNFGTVLPVWDLLFRTAVYDYKPRPTGVDDSADADNGKGWIGQQVAGFARLGRALIAMVRPRAVRAPAE
ncbi:MAG: sterol desaturase family protein [Rhodospirillales bacterium]|nr:MAG: sterol desaturase family protein [Rhodospirillales bacterium]